MTGSVSKTGVLSQISLEALRSAESLAVRDVATLFEHLYTYNSVPLTANWERRFPDAGVVRKELGLIPESVLGPLLQSHWVLARGEAENGWLNWVRPSRYERLAGAGSAVEFKLYLSPAVEALTPAVTALVETLSFSHATSFKVGADARGLLRPDKLIAYFQSLADLTESAQRLADHLADVPAQGVPFTAEIAGDGLVSWGVDPPEKAKVLGKTAPSWREWVCHQLAVGLVEAEREGDGSEPLWKQALERLERMGVQVERWLPAPAHWGFALQ